MIWGENPLFSETPIYTYIHQPRILGVAVHVRIQQIADLYGGVWENILLGGGSNILYFHPNLGKISTLTNIFERRWNHQLDYVPKLGCVSRQLLFERLEIQALGQAWRRVWWSPFQALKFKDYYLDVSKNSGFSSVEIHDHPATLCIDTCILAFTL